MAESIENEKDHPSKIPRYSKSKIPVLSSEYKNTLRNVRLKNSYRNKITLMKHGIIDNQRSGLETQVKSLMLLMLHP